MHQFSLEYLRCVNCSGTLEIEILEQSHEIEEGFLACNNCDILYLIISKIGSISNSKYSDKQM
ncbi:MAG: hypothetical protein HY222_03815 [Thaumarchaeota archaeon]|nr:hypothetical protein [Nitrososphaerota archaeon]MBI3641501.1 hypothetical protein [Nitrososphaerota archaeon]